MAFSSHNIDPGSHNVHGATLIQPVTDSTSVFQIQNASAQTLLVADTTNQRVAIGPAAVPANGVLTVGTNTTTASGGIYLGTDTNLYRSAAATLKTDGALIVAGLLTGQAGATIQGAAISLNASSNFATNINTGTSTGAVTIGNTTAAETVTIQGGTGASALALSTGSGGTLSIGNAGLAGTIQIGNTTGAVAQTINIGNNATASSTSTVKIGSTIGSSTTTIQGGTGNINLNPNGASGTGVVIQPIVDTTGALLVKSAAPSGVTILVVDTINGEVGIGAAPAGNSELYVQSASDTVIRGKNTGTADLLQLANNTSTVLTATNAGQLQLSVQGSTGGIVLGGDVQLYRVSASLLGLGGNDSLRVFSSGGSQSLTVSSDTSSVYLDSRNSSSSDWVVVSKVTSDSQQRYILKTDGEMQWGSGSATPDVILSRTGAGALALTPTANSTTAFQVQDASGTKALDVDTTNNRIGINITGTPVAELEIHRDLEASRNNRIALTTGDGEDWYIGQPQGTSDLTLSLNGGGSALRLFAGTSAALFKNTTDSTTAFQVQNSGGNSLVQVNTSTPTITLFGGVTGGILITDIAGTATTHGVCHSGSSGASANVQLVACTTPVGADYAELYPSQPDVEAGDVVMSTPTYATSKDGKYQVPVLAKTNSAYDAGTIGVISEIDPNSDESNLTGNNVNTADHPMPLSLNGRVMTKVNTENGDIAAGDYITASSTPGVGMKATAAGEVIGRAMQSYDGTGTGQILVFVNPFYYDGPTITDTIQNGGSANLSSLNVTGTADFADLNVSGTTTINNLTVTTLSATTATIGTLTVTGSAQFTGDITVGGHVITAGQTPATQAESAAGTGATCTVTGNDTGGSVTITTGTGGLADGSQCTLTFHNTFGHVPNPVVSPRSKTGAQAGVFADADTSTMTIQFANTPVAGTTYVFNYFNTQ